MRALACVFVVFTACAGSAGRASTPAATTAPTTTAAPRAVAITEAMWPPVPRDAVAAHVTRVVDGDTIVLTGIDVGYGDSRGRPGHHARLIGIDTPEVFGHAGCFGAQASAFTKRELAGRDVRVGFDVDPTDRYGRALVYVWKTDGTLFNGELAEDGYALQLTIPPDVRYAEEFTRYVRDARDAGRGLWRACL